MGKEIMIDQEVKDSIRDSVLCWLATADAAGEPNVSPKEMFVSNGDGHILVADIASPNSVKNIEANPWVCLSFIDIFKQKGYKVKGIATIINSTEPDYEAKAKKLRQLGGEKFQIKSIIEIKVTSAQPIIAPSYWLFPETTEQSQIEQAMNTYKVTSSVTFHNEQAREMR